MISACTKCHTHWSDCDILAGGQCAACLEKEIERLRAERDEAREAARDFREMYGPLFVNDIPDVEHWPWLEVSDE